MTNSITAIYINSKDRGYGTITNFNYQLPQGIPVAENYYISSASIPFTQYVTIYKPIGGSGDVSFNISDNSGLHVVELAPGNYTAFGAATTLQAALNTASGGTNYTVVYNSLTYTYTITYLADDPWILYWNTDDQLPGQHISYTFGFQPVELMGMASYTSTQAATASGTSYNYYIKSQSLTLNGSYAYLQDQKDSVISQIPLNAQTGGLIQYVNPLGEWIKLNGVALSTIDVQLVDDYNNPVDTNGLDWTFSLFIRNRSY